jgi:hypothetical protein
VTLPSGPNIVTPDGEKLVAGDPSARRNVSEATPTPGTTLSRAWTVPSSLTNEKEFARTSRGVAAWAATTGGNASKMATEAPRNAAVNGRRPSNRMERRMKGTPFLAHKMIQLHRY